MVYQMTSFDFAVLITSTWLNQCVQYLQLTSGPKRKNEYNNFCFLRRVEVLEKMFSLAPGPALIPGLQASSSSLFSSCPTSSCSKAVCFSLYYGCRSSDQVQLVSLAFGIEDLSLVVGDVCALFHADSERFQYAFKIFASKYSSISSVQCLTFQGVLPLKKFQFKHFFASYRAVRVVVASVLASTLG